MRESGKQKKRESHFLYVNERIESNQQTNKQKGNLSPFFPSKLFSKSVSQFFFLK